MNHFKSHKARSVLSAACGLTLACTLSACATMEELADMAFEKPEVSVIDARLTGLSFESADFMFDVQIENPNAIGISLAGFNYNLAVNDNAFVQGEQNDTIEIEADGKSTLQIPVTLNYKDLYKTFTSLRGQDHAKYKMSLGFDFDLPFLGRQRIPLTHEGTLPLPKVPKLTVLELDLKRLNVTGANLNLKVKMWNPNAFSFALKRMKYSFDISGKQWLSGNKAENMQVSAKSESILDFPISLNFFEIGRSVFQLLSGNEPLAYNFKGRFEIETSVPLIGTLDFPFHQTGRLPLVKR